MDVFKEHVKCRRVEEGVALGMFEGKYEIPHQRTHVVHCRRNRLRTAQIDSVRSVRPAHTRLAIESRTLMYILNQVLGNRTLFLPRTMSKRNAISDAARSENV